MYVISIDGCKKIDSYSINRIGIPSIVLMENAGHRIYEGIVHKGEKFIVFCGEGNNGGDGLVIARKLIKHKKQVHVVILGNGKKRTHGFITNYNILKNLDTNIINIYEDTFITEEIRGYIKSSDVVVDAIFGIGLNRNVTGIFYDVIKIINEYSNYIVSVDIPSGINGDSGDVLGVAIKANETYTVEVYKTGFFKL